MKKVLALFALLLLVTSAALAQTTIEGKVKDKKTGESLSFVTVVLTKQGDKTPLKSDMTDESGAFRIAGVQNGQYSVSISFVGYKEYIKNVSVAGGSLKLGTIQLAEESTSLKEVTVTGQRSSVKLEVDRKSFDVSQDIANAGGSASEVLENIPSVEVDQDGNVSLRGNSSVEVWINGRQSGLTSDNRADILKQLPAESIEKIEVIDNPSSKFSAEGSAGIINIVLKKNRKAGYYGSLSAGGDTRGGANANANINYNSSKIDAFASIGYRHMQNKGKSESEQHNYDVDANGNRLGETTWSKYATANENFGNNIFARLGATWHMTSKDDLGFSTNFMKGAHNRSSNTPYHYGNAGSLQDTRTQYRNVSSKGNMGMQNYELNYRHTWSTTHLLDFVASYSTWAADNKSYYRDSVNYFSPAAPTTYAYTLEPFDVKNHHWEVRLDYENQITDWFKLEAGYNGTFAHENTPNEQWAANNWNGDGATLNAPYYNRFIYDNDIHALYTTTSFKLTPKFSLMAGLRGEYWTVNTKTYRWNTALDGGKGGEELDNSTVFKKNFFQLFPSLFLSYQLTEKDQLQLNYTRRLRRPHGGELNSFMNTSDATYVHYGNPELTPEFSNSFSLNYLRQWGNHSVLVSAYYRNTTDVMSHVSYTLPSEYEDSRVFQTTMNLTESTNAGLELTMKNKFFKILDLTTNVNLYNRHVSGFDYDTTEPLHHEKIHASDEAEDRFTWNARMQASFLLPAGFSFQLSGRYRSKQIQAQGYSNANFVMQAGLRKTFARDWTLAVNCRDLLNSRKRESFTDTQGFTQHAINRWGGRSVMATLTYSFGNSKPKFDKKKMRDEDGEGHDHEEGGGFDGYSAGGE
ncbi:MAG: TonB-dependent receptor [Bacteroidaceae bacterium]|nr:TonB-dependent receptor [Bacteroidaceae bacterium]